MLTMSLSLISVENCFANICLQYMAVLTVICGKTLYWVVRLLGCVRFAWFVFSHMQNKCPKRVSAM